MENLEEYITLVVDNSVKVGITHQMRAFREGFEHVRKLQTFLLVTLASEKYCILKQILLMLIFRFFQCQCYEFSMRSSFLICFAVVVRCGWLVFLSKVSF